MQKKKSTTISNVVFDEIISLGGSCQVAVQLNRLNLRFKSYPFDWLFSLDINKVIDALNSDFKDWLLLDNLEEGKRVTEHRKIIDKKYDMIHQHIFTLDIPYTESYKKVKKTVDRRLKRFLKLKKRKKPILFVRTNLKLEDIKKLSEVINKKYGSNSYLLVVNHLKKIKFNCINTDLENVFIYEIYDENFKSDIWQGYNLHWDKIFKNVKINKKNSLFKFLKF